MHFWPRLVKLAAAVGPECLRAPVAEKRILSMAPKPSSQAQRVDPRLAVFVACYVETRDATASARRAGYPSPTRTARQLLALREVQALIEKLRSSQDSPFRLTYEFLDAHLIDVIRTAENHVFRGCKDRVDALRLAYQVVALRQDEQLGTEVPSNECVPENNPVARPLFYIPKRKRGEDGIVCPESEKVEERLLGQDSTGAGCGDGGDATGVGTKDEGTGSSA